MQVRPWAQLRADFPDDSVEHDGNIVQYGGRSVADAIAQLLRELGCEVEPPHSAGLNGWELDVRIENRSLWCQITRWFNHDDDYFILFEQNAPFKNPFRPYHPAYLDVLQRLADKLAHDPRFHDIDWHVEPDTDKPGTARPIIRS